MKVNPFDQALRYFQGVRPKAQERAEKDPHSQGQGYSQNERRKESSASSQENPDSDAQAESDPDEFNRKLKVALDHSNADPENQNGGITVTTQGKGPGLKVVMKDSAGLVVRQLTGSEFLRLRQSAENHPKHKGKILDQKQ